MKTSSDPRHLKRQYIVQQLYANSFHHQRTSEKKVAEILSNTESIDSLIEKIAPEFPLVKINKVELAILRLAVFELTVEKTTPPKVIVDEAVELAKEFGGDASPGFINGALGKLLKDHLDKKPEAIDDKE